MIRKRGELQKNFHNHNYGATHEVAIYLEMLLKSFHTSS